MHIDHGQRASLAHGEEITVGQRRQFRLVHNAETTDAGLGSVGEGHFDLTLFEEVQRFQLADDGRGPLHVHDEGFAELQHPFSRLGRLIAIKQWIADFRVDHLGLRIDRHVVGGAVWRLHQHKGIATDVGGNIRALFPSTVFRHEHVLARLTTCHRKGGRLCALAAEHDRVVVAGRGKFRSCQNDGVCFRRKAHRFRRAQTQVAVGRFVQQRERFVEHGQLRCCGLCFGGVGRHNRPQFKIRYRPQWPALRIVLTETTEA